MDLELSADDDPASTEGVGGSTRRLSPLDRPHGQGTQRLRDSGGGGEGHDPAGDRRC